MFKVLSHDCHMIMPESHDCHMTRAAAEGAEQQHGEPLPHLGQPNASGAHKVPGGATAEHHQNSEHYVIPAIANVC